MVNPRFGMWATGVGGVVRKKGAGDGGFLYKTILIYLKGGLFRYHPQNMRTQNKQT